MHLRASVDPVPANPPEQQSVDEMPSIAKAHSTSNPATWLEGGAAILNSSGGLLEINDPLRVWLENLGVDAGLGTFWEILERVSTSWAEPLVHLAHDTSPFGQMNLSLTPVPHAKTHWFHVEVARAPHSIFFRINSILEPKSSWNLEPPEDGARSPSAERDLFGRWLRAGPRVEEVAKMWPCIVFSQQPDFAIQYASPNIKELTGLDAADICGRGERFWKILHESDVAALRSQIKHAVETHSSVTNTYRIRHAVNGRVAYILENRQPVVSPDGLLLGYEVVWLDVTRQTIAERRLAMAAWKETLAVLTLGMAHDFTNVIAGIHSLSESFLAQLEENHPFHEGLGLIKKSSLQASQLVHRMISLHLGQIGERNYHNLNEIGRDLVDLVKKTLPRRIELVTELCEAQLPVYLDVVEFRQAVINLILNAADAMPRGGKLAVRTNRFVELPIMENMKGAVPRLPCVCLTVKDTGIGIKQRHLASLFDPFFTTKVKGSGLGLYNARLAVEKAKGAISVSSVEGIGTEFHIWLPEANFSESDQTELAFGRNTERNNLLLLGQPGDFLEKTSELLRSQNYYVVTASPAESLSEFLHSTDYHFDGVVILIEAGDTVSNSLPAEIRQQNKSVKIIMKTAGCNHDELDPQLLGEADLLLSADLPETELLGKLKSFLGQKA